MITFNTRTRHDISIDEQCRMFPDGGDMGTHNPCAWMDRIAPDWAEEALIVGDFYPQCFQGWWRRTPDKLMGWEYEIHEYVHNYRSWWYKDSFNECEHTGEDARNVAMELHQDEHKRENPYQNKYYVLVDGGDELLKIAVTASEFWSSFLAGDDA